MRSILFVLALTFASLPIVPVGAITSTTIAIDGDLADWAGVRADPANTSQDTQITDPDPDYPGQPDRDTYLVNATWDNEYLYIAMRRTSGGTKAISWVAYIDRGGDGLLHNEDVACIWKTNQNQGRYADAHAADPTARILRYNQAIVGQGGPLLHPAGDPMGYDGETPDGWADVQSGEILPQKAMDGWLTADGIEFEGRVAWTDLGLAPGSLIAIHFANANGESLGQKWVPSDTRKWTGQPPQYLEENRGQVEDNVDDIWWLRQRGVSVSPDNQGGGDAGDTVVYTHTVKNSSNTSDTFDLSAVSDRGWPVSITDTAGDPLASVSLAAGESRTIRVRVRIPNGTTDGTRDITTVSAISRADATVTDSATDTTTSGRITVTPDQSASMAPGQTVSYTFNVTNNLPGTPRTYDLAALSSLGWRYTVTSPSGGSLSSVTLASGESTKVVVSVSVPPTATVGMQDATRLMASLQGLPSVRSFATATTTVRDGLTLAPNNTGYAGAGSPVFYSHTVTNSWPTTRTVTLSATSSRGWPVVFYAADGVTQITSVTVGPNGAAAQVFARISVPGGTAANTVDVTTVRATTGATTVTATDTTTVRRLMVYADTSYATPVNTFDLTDEVFARATGLNPGDTVYFVWYDQNGNVVRTSPERTVDTQGMMFDSYDTQVGNALGDSWRVELWRRVNKNSTSLLETSTFKVHDKADITALSATDAPGVGSDVAVTSSVENFIGKPINDSTMTYVIWWDENGDGLFGAGDTWIDGAGAPHTWDGTSAIQTHVTGAIDVTSNGMWTDAGWTVNNRRFPHQGNYNVTATWRTATGQVIDIKTTQFYSIPALGWPLFALAFLGALAILGRRLPFDPRRGEAT